MRAKILSIVALSFFLPLSCEAQNLTISQWIDVYTKACIGGGSSDSASGQLDANGDISLKKIALSGQIQGQVQVSHADAQLLVNGISDATTQVAANVAEQVRECFAPMRNILVQVMAQQMLPNSSSTFEPTNILDPYQNALIKVVANTTGETGHSGQDISYADVEKLSPMSDLRYQVTVNELLNEGYLEQYLSDASKPAGPYVLSLTSQGKKYALDTGLAN